MTWGGFFLGLVLALVGWLLVWKTEWLVQNFGRVPWAEEYLGAEGGSRIFWKALGVLIIILGFGIMTGVWQPMFKAILSPLFRGITR